MNENGTWNGPVVFRGDGFYRPVLDDGTVDERPLVRQADGSYREAVAGERPTSGRHVRMTVGGT